MDFSRSARPRCGAEQLPALRARPGALLAGQQIRGAPVQGPRGASQASRASLNHKKPIECLLKYL